MDCAGVIHRLSKSALCAQHNILYRFVRLKAFLSDYSVQAHCDMFAEAYSANIQQADTCMHVYKHPG